MSFTTLRSIRSRSPLSPGQLHLYRQQHSLAEQNPRKLNKKCGAKALRPLISVS